MIKKFFKLLARALPHFNISLCLVFATLLIVDRFNRAMAFVNNDITKGMLAAFLVLVIIESIILIAAKGAQKEPKKTNDPPKEGSDE